MPPQPRVRQPAPGSLGRGLEELPASAKAPSTGAPPVSDENSVPGAAGNTAAAAGDGSDTLATNQGYGAGPGQYGSAYRSPGYSGGGLHGSSYGGGLGGYGGGYGMSSYGGYGGYGGYSSMGMGGYGGYGRYGSMGMGMGMGGMMGPGGGMMEQMSWLNSIQHFTSSLGYLTELLGMNTQALGFFFGNLMGMLEGASSAMASLQPWQEFPVGHPRHGEPPPNEEQERRRQTKVKVVRWVVGLLVVYAGYKLIKLWRSGGRSLLHSPRALSMSALEEAYPRQRNHDARFNPPRRPRLNQRAEVPGRGWEESFGSSF